MVMIKEIPRWQKEFQKLCTNHTFASKQLTIYAQELSNVNFELIACTKTGAMLKQVRKQSMISILCFKCLRGVKGVSKKAHHGGESGRGKKMVVIKEIPRRRKEFQKPRCQPPKISLRNK